MRLAYFILFLFCSSLCVDAQLSNIKWVSNSQGENSEWPWDVKTDQLGNVYIVGHFYSDTLRVNGILLYSKIKNSNFSKQNVFILKYTQNGELIWAKNFHSDGNIGYPHMDISKSNHIILTYYASQFSIIRYDTHQIHLPKENYRGMIVNYLDENANLLWHKILIDSLNTLGHGRILFDHNEDIVVGGVSLSGTMYDEKGNVLIRDSGRVKRCFLLKLDKDGRVIWTKSYGNENSSYLSAITTDQNNNLIVYGYFYGPEYKMDGITLLNRSRMHLGNVLTDYYVAKLDPEGRVLWANSIYGTDYNDVIDAKIITDQKGSIYINGLIQSDTLHFDDRVRLYKSQFNVLSKRPDLFYAKYNSDGNVVWAKRIVYGDPGAADYFTLTMSPDGRLFVAGTYDFTGIRSGEIMLPVYGLSDIYLFECNQDGDIISKASFGSSDYDWISDIHFDQESNLYVAGAYSGPELQIGGTTLFNSNTDRSTDMLLFKLCPEPVSAVSKTEKIINVVYLSDLHSIMIQGLEGTEKGVCSLYDISGIVILKKELIMDPDTVIPLPELAGGVYIAEIRTARGQYCTKIIRR